MRRVVITGMGITSCLGNDLDTVSAALREQRAGITRLEDHAEVGMRSQVGGRVDIDLDAQIDRKLKRFIIEAAAYAYIAARDAVAHAGLTPEQVSNPRTGLIAGSGGGSSHWQVESAALMRERGVRKVGPYMVPRTMGSAVGCLRHQRPLHRRRRRPDPPRRPGHRAGRWRRGPALDHQLPVRRDGRTVHQLQRHPGHRLAAV